MNRIRRVEPLVQEILENNEETRSDDFVLITQVYYRINPDVINLNFGMVMLGHKELGLPSTSSIMRARRKIFEKHPELKPEKITELRKEEEQAYRDYANDLN